MFIICFPCVCEFFAMMSFLMSSIYFSAFVKSDRPDQFPGLSVKYMRGADPQLLLLDENKQVQETLAIDKWDTDTVEEFLHQQLKK